MNVALIVFAGSGKRITSSIPKQFIKIKNKELIVYTIEKFQSSNLINEIVLVTHKDYVDLVNQLVKKHQLSKVKHIIVGGDSRQESVRLGLVNTNYDPKDNILIHDGDRLLVDHNIIEDNVKSLEDNDVVCTYISHARALQTISNLGRMKKINGEQVDIQTPQSFKYGLIKKYHIKRANEFFSDDISLVENNYDVKYIRGNKYNFKVTTDLDLKVLKTLL